MKKYIYIFLLFAIIANWSNVSRILGLSSHKYTIGDYQDTRWYSGHTGYAEALKVSDKNETPVLIYIYTDWCKYCKKFEATLLTNRQVNSSLARFVKIKLNPDKSDQDKQLYKKLNAKGFPTIMFQYGASGKIIRVRAPYTKYANNWKLMTADEFINILHKYGT